ncbi:hypothetical protein RchiOBHm_Chr5g0079981 [Rosa chinensis]|uniref:Uncharacterized protein n=1 Tax=Rosa chinensis TaxID=74649 RepID=A0A2P6QMM2_ROSCH|nr:hypothetical protein RchiOBHm_Chr5g0079981 [Rosa chinensis]
MAAAPSPTSGYPNTTYVLYASISSLMPIFKAHNLLGYVDCSITPPEKFLQNDAGEPTTAISSSYETWMAHEAKFKPPETSETWLESLLPPPPLLLLRPRLD